MTQLFNEAKVSSIDISDDKIDNVHKIVKYLIHGIKDPFESFC